MSRKSGTVARPKLDEHRTMNWKTLVPLSLLALAPLALRAQTITAPDTAKMGGPVQVTLSGTYDPQDFLSIVATGTAEGKYDAYEYARSATVTLTAPDTPGSYEIRLLA